MSDNMLKMGPLAFLVDGDNASASYVGDMLVEVSRYGPVIIRRVYGNWESPMMVGWKKQLQRFALAPSQQFPNRGKKNVTDFALVIDAMDILHEGVVKGFCIVSSDSDYTSLAMRIREQGLYVIGIGEEKTHDSFRNACDIFIMVENLGDYGGSRRRRRKPIAQSGGQPSEEKVIKKRNPYDAVDFIDKAFDMVMDEDRRASMSEIGQMLNRLDPSFSPRTFGKQKLTDLIQSLPDHFNVERELDGTPFARRVDNGHEEDFEPEEIPEKLPEVKKDAEEPKVEVQSKRKRRRRKPKKEGNQQDKGAEEMREAGAKVPEIGPALGAKPALVDDVPDDDELKNLLQALYEDGSPIPRKADRITDIRFKPLEAEKTPEGAEVKKSRSRRQRKRPEPKPEDAAGVQEPKPESKPADDKRPEPRPEDAAGTHMPKLEADGSKPKSRSRRKRKPKQNPTLLLLIQVIDESARDGRVHLAQLSKAIKKIDPEFDLAKLGKKRMTDLIKDYPDHFVLEGEGSSMYVKRK